MTAGCPAASSKTLKCHNVGEPQTEYCLPVTCAAPVDVLATSSDPKDAIVESADSAGAAVTSTPAGAIVTSADAAGASVTSADPVGDPAGRVVSPAEPVGAIVTSIDAAGASVTSGDPLGAIVTSAEPAGGLVTPAEPAGELVSSVPRVALGSAATSLSLPSSGPEGIDSDFAHVCMNLDQHETAVLQVPSCRGSKANGELTLHGSTGGAPGSSQSCPTDRSLHSRGESNCCRSQSSTSLRSPEHGAPPWFQAAAVACNHARRINIPTARVCFIQLLWLVLPERFSSAFRPLSSFAWDRTLDEATQKTSLSLLTIGSRGQ